MKSARLRHRWLRGTRQYWKFRGLVWLGRAAHVSLLCGLTAIPLALFVRTPFWIVALAALPLSAAVAAARKFLVSRLFACPRCSRNPTRRQSDGKPITEQKLWRRLENLDACPNCSFAGESPQNPERKEARQRTPEKAQGG
ncbi:MAG: hypothetical protein QGG36_33035 [Pirellulaceae bacterium]|jgi:hypothetical protein|nr:hypothetical protein [Pirellulaceae bacterium]MDP7020658.1 hypothetical protein [Pirellulaceae bacterium]